MSLSKAQLKQLDRQLDQNQREMAIFPLDEMLMQSLGFGSDEVATRAPQVCARAQSAGCNGAWSTTQAGYTATLHPFFNTSWGIPTALGAYDTYNITRLLRDIGGFTTKVRISVHNGRQYLILTGYPGLRRILKGTRYGIRNPQVVEVGIGKYGIRGTSMSGFRLSVYVGVGVEVLEWVFNDEAVMTDLFAGIGVELIKAGIASAVGYGAALLIGTVFTFAAAPVIGGALIVFGIGVGLNELDNHYQIKSSIKDGLRYSVEHIHALHEKAIKITPSNIKIYAKKKSLDIAADLADTLTRETKKWVLKKIDHSGFSTPSRKSIHRYPNIFNLNPKKIER